MTVVEAVTARAFVAAIAIAGLFAADATIARMMLTEPLLAGAALADDDDDDGRDDDDDDDDRRPIPRREREAILIDPSQQALTRARALGFRVVETVDARAVGLTVVRLAVPRGWSMNRARRALEAIAPNDADVNHFYRPLAGKTCARGICLSHRQINWPGDTRNCGIDRRIGIVDTAVETAHPALRHARIATRAFTKTPARPNGHGTAIAALLVGAPDTEFAGLMPRAELLAADPFALHPQGAVADAVAVIRALDWLAGSGIRVIGLSFGGPPNIALQRAVANLHAKGVILIAAAGNNGRTAKPVYPAAYADVVAVTAVDAQGRAYARANRGAYIDYAAPGVALWTAETNGRGRTRSGTSLAVPFVVAATVEHMAQSRATAALGQQPAQQIATIDLGPRGRDDVYGNGLIVHKGGCGP